MDARLIQFHISPQIEKETDQKNRAAVQNGFNLADCKK